MAMSKRELRNEGQRGFTLIEVMISMLILVIGLVALLALFANTLATMHMAQQDLIAKQKAMEAMETIFAARNDAQIGYAQINNVSNGGIFTDGWTPLYGAGTNGIIGTTTTSGGSTTVESVVTPGPDGVIGTTDDVTTPLTNFQRQITIGPTYNPDASVNPNLKTITVAVQYTAPPFPARTFTVQSLISSYR